MSVTFAHTASHKYIYSYTQINEVNMYNLVLKMPNYSIHMHL